MTRERRAITSASAYKCTESNTNMPQTLTNKKQDEKWTFIRGNIQQIGEEIGKSGKS